MQELISLFFKSVFIENMIFAYFLGMCSYLAVSKTVKTAMGLGIAVTFVLVITLPVNYLLENYVLKAGALEWLDPSFADLDLSFLSFIMFIAIIAAMVQLIEMVVRKVRPGALCCTGYFLATHRGKLFDPWCLALHARACIHQCGPSHGIRPWFRNRLAACHRRYCGHP